MTADTLKTTRVLELYQDFLSGKLINKQQAAEQYHVNVRSIQRDIDSIRDFLSEQCAKEGIVRKIEYDKVDEKEGVCSIEAEVFGTGVKMWLLSQGSKIRVTAPETLVQEIKPEIERMNNQY